LRGTSFPRSPLRNGYSSHRHSHFVVRRMKLALDPEFLSGLLHAGGKDLFAF
jgi:hypothetical protein